MLSVCSSSAYSCTHTPTQTPVRCVAPITLFNLFPAFFARSCQLSAALTRSASPWPVPTERVCLFHSPSSPHETPFPATLAPGRLSRHRHGKHLPPCDKPSEGLPWTVAFGQEEAVLTCEASWRGAMRPIVLVQFPGDMVRDTRRSAYGCAFVEQRSRGWSVRSHRRLPRLQFPPCLAPILRERGTRLVPSMPPNARSTPVDELLYF